MRCLYVDLDGTLLGPNASLLRGGDGRFSAMAVRALEACWRADVEVVLYSGRKQSSVFETSRLIGADSYIFELGCGLVVDGELEWLVFTPTRLAAEPRDERADATRGHPRARGFLGGQRLRDLGSAHLWDAQRKMDVDLGPHVFPDVGDDVEHSAR